MPRRVFPPFTFVRKRKVSVIRSCLPAVLACIRLSFREVQTSLSGTGKPRSIHSEQYKPTMIVQWWVCQSSEAISGCKNQTSPIFRSAARTVLSGLRCEFSCLSMSAAALFPFRPGACPGIGTIVTGGATSGAQKSANSSRQDHQRHSNDSNGNHGSDHVPQLLSTDYQSPHLIHQQGNTVCRAHLNRDRQQKILSGLQFSSGCRHRCHAGRIQ